MAKAALEEKVIVGKIESVEEYNKRLYELKLRDYKYKPLHGAFVKDIEGIAVEESWRWLGNGYFKKGTEGMICVAQEQVLRTNSVKCYSDKTSDSPFSGLLEKAWRVCGT